MEHLPSRSVGPEKQIPENPDLTAEQNADRRAKIEEARSLKVGDEVMVSGMDLAPMPTKGRIIELKNPGTDSPGPKVMLTEGPNAGQTLESLFRGQYKKVGSSLEITNEGT